MSLGFLALAALTTTVIEPMPGEKWWGGAPIAGENSVTVRLPAGRWRDDLGELHEGPKTLALVNVPTSRVPRFEKLD